MNVARQEDNIYIRHATAIAVATITLLMLLISGVFYQQSEAGDTARGWVTHTYEVIGHVQALFSKIKDAEIGERGYLLAGNEEYLEPYNQAIKIIPANQKKNASLDDNQSITEELAILRDLTLDNPVQQRNIDELDGVVHDLLKYTDDMITLRRTQNMGAIKQEIEFHRGKEMMDHIRILIRVMIAEEARLLETRNKIDDISTRQNKRFVSISIALFYISMILAIVFYQRYRNRVQTELINYTHELETSEEELQRGEEELRTQQEELQTSNEELEEQNARIRQQSAELEESKRMIEEKVRELEVAGKYKSEFLANMSHELRTPLNSLLILARSLASNEDGNLTEEQVEEAKVIHNGGLELLNLINDILDLSKVEAGKLNIIAEDVFLEGTIKRLRQQFEPVAKESSVDFIIKTSENIPMVLHTDAQRMEQIIKNLLSNAFKFTEVGSVTLDIHRPDSTVELQRESLATDSVLAFSVIDTGIGIDANKFKDIFVAFQQEDGSTDRHYGGTGLGLTIARKFAHMLGGEIHVASEKGKGSVFTLLLPIHLAESEEQADAADGNHQGNGKTPLKVMPRTTIAEFIADDRKNIGDHDKVLLIIEDDPEFATILMRIAHKRGYKCLVAGNGKNGLLLAIEERVHAIILDLKLPDMDGMRVLEQLKHHLPSRHIPVHIITADDRTSAAPLRKGAIGYITKPVGEDEINQAFTKIETMLQSELKHILVIEDDKKSQIAVASLLKKKDTEITLVGQGQKALEMLASTHFDCIILDLRLPDMNGFEWLEKMEKVIGESGSPPVIIYTAKDLTEEENRQLSHYTGSIIIKGAKSADRLLDEVTLFLHSVESTLSKDQQEIIRMQHDPDKVLTGRTILLVDDDLRNTFALSKLLKKHGMQIVIADNGQMALDKLNNESPSIDLVIMDIMMPVMDGYQAIEAIRKQEQYQLLPIIALTARAMPEEQVKCMVAGANDYLTKPVDVERLLTLLRVWLFKQEMGT